MKFLSRVVCKGTQLLELLYIFSKKMHSFNKSVFCIAFLVCKIFLRNNFLNVIHKKKCIRWKVLRNMSSMEEVAKKNWAFDKEGIEKKGFQ